MSAANKKTAEGRVFPVGAHKISNHNRWHVKRSMINENCELCLDDGS